MVRSMKVASVPMVNNVSVVVLQEIVVREPNAATTVDGAPAKEAKDPHPKTATVVTMIVTV